MTYPLPDLIEPITEICQRLGLNPNHVRRLDLHAAEHRATVEIYLLNEHGKHYINDDGEPAIETRTYHRDHELSKTQ